MRGRLDTSVRQTETKAIPSIRGAEVYPWGKGKHLRGRCYSAGVCWNSNLGSAVTSETNIGAQGEYH